MSRSVTLQKPSVVLVPDGSYWFSPLDMAVDCRDYRFAYVMVETLVVEPVESELPKIKVMTCPTLTEDISAWTEVASGVPSGYGHSTLVIDCGQFAMGVLPIPVRPNKPRISGYLRLLVAAPSGNLSVNLRAVALLKEPARFMVKEWLPPFQLNVGSGDLQVVMPQELWLDCVEWDDLFVLVQWDGRILSGSGDGMAATLVTATDLVLEAESRGNNYAVKDLEGGLLASATGGPVRWVTLQGLTLPNNDTGSPGPAGKAWLVFSLSVGLTAAGSARAWVLAKKDW